MGPKPAVRPRTGGGGFNQGIGHFNEHLDEQAFQQASQQKALTQQVADPRTAQAVSQQGQSHATGAPQQPPRELGSLTDELIKRPAQTIADELKAFLDINTWLGIKPAEDPQEQARQKQIHDRYMKLDEEQKAVARKNFEQRMQKKQQEEQEEEQRKQMEAQQKEQTVVVPASSQKGPQGPGGSRKQKAVTKLQQDRKTLGGPSSAN